MTLKLNQWDTFWKLVTLNLYTYQFICMYLCLCVWCIVQQLATAEYTAGWKSECRGNSQLGRTQSGTNFRCHFEAITCVWVIHPQFAAGLRETASCSFMEREMAHSDQSLCRALRQLTPHTDSEITTSRLISCTYSLVGEQGLRMKDE